MTPSGGTDLTQKDSLVLQTYDVLPVSRHEEAPVGSPESPLTQEPSSIRAQTAQVAAQADALTTDEERNFARFLLNNDNSFTTDSLDCGLTSVHIPNHQPKYAPYHTAY